MEEMAFYIYIILWNAKLLNIGSLNVKIRYLYLLVVIKLIVFYYLS